VVRGSAVNQDGRSNGLMAPNPAAQMAVLRAACSNAGVPPHEVDYVEAHATGTLLGDPIEARALGTVLGRMRPRNTPLLIGSVKPSLGHLDAAAGIAGFIKAALALKRGQIPSNLNFRKPNPHIPFGDMGLKVVAEHMDWPATGRPRRAGVSSFGFGGTNAHVVLEQEPDRAFVTPANPESVGAVTTLVVSGKTPERVASAAAVLAQWMDGAGAGVPLAEVAHTLNHHRTRHAKFATVAALDRAQAISGLRALAAGGSADGVVAPHHGVCRPGTVFVYSGHGSHWAGMGRRLLADEPGFAAAVAELEPIFVSQVGFSLQQQLTSGDAVAGADRSLPVLLGVQLALTKLWRSYGVQPDAVIGHSTGEVAASVVAGALSVADGLRVIAALHRPTIDALADLAPQPPTIPVITANVTPPVFDADYWTGDLHDPARFRQAVTAAGADHGTFVEISPDPVLTGAIDEALGDLHHHSIGTLARDKHDTLTFRTNLNATHTTRAPDAEHPPEPHPIIPTTLWHHTRHWIGSPVHHGVNGFPKPATEPDGSRDETDFSAGRPAQHWLTIKQRVESAVSAPRSGTLLGEHIGVATTPPVHLWQAWLNHEDKPYPGLHRIRGVEMVPLSILLQTLSTAAAECGASALSDVRFEDPIIVGEPQVIQVVADDELVTVASGSAADAPAHEWTRHASARISHRLPGAPGAALNGSGRNVAGDPLPVEELFAELQRTWGIEAQPLGWSIGSCRSAPDALQIDVNLPEASTVALLDAAIQVARLTNSSDPRLMIPSGAESVHFGAGLTDSHACIQVSRRSGIADEFTVDIMVTAPDGTTCVDIRALQYVAVESAPAEVAAHDESATLAWSEMPAESLLSELEIRMQAIVARQLGMAASAVGMDRPFPELGLDSMMAMTVLRDAKQLVGFDISATMLWDHPTISSLAAYLANLLAQQLELDASREQDRFDATLDPQSGLLDELFDSVESAAASGESGTR
jgi:phthiocerol/phenolphthiocerol synthesis type-I polyketide synthase A